VRIVARPAGCLSGDQYGPARESHRKGTLDAHACGPGIPEARGFPDLRRVRRAEVARLGAIGLGIRPRVVRSRALRQRGTADPSNEVRPIVRNFLQVLAARASAPVVASRPGRPTKRPQRRPRRAMRLLTARANA